MKQKLLLIGIGILVLLGVVAAGSYIFIQKTVVPSSTPTIAQSTDAFSYKGETGKDALTLLEEKTTVEQAQSGLVIAINGRKADDKKHEFWAFFVNGKEAEVGPASYKTKDTDTIAWRIERY